MKSKHYSMVFLGVLLLVGTLHAATSSDKARPEASHFQKAAQAGDPEAMYKLSICYRDGLGVPRSRAESLVWCRKAAAKGYSKAIYNLGVAYLNGLGVAKDEKQAVEWFRQAAVNGFPCLPAFERDAFLGGLRSHPDYRDLLDWLRAEEERLRGVL